MKRKKICVVTGSRAEYGIFYPVLLAIRDSTDLQLQLIATGMHLMKEFGYTVKLIRKDGFPVHTVNMSYHEDTGEAMSEAFGKAVKGLTRAFIELKPDMILILGDRNEALASAIVANYLNIPVAHIHGGEVSGHVDGNIRHAITKLVHLHFPATRKSAERIIKMGEEPWRVQVCGAPALDRMVNEELPDVNELRKKYKIDAGRKLVLVVQHPVHTEIQDAPRQMRLTMEAVIKTGAQIIGIYSNADAGGRAMIREIKKFRQNPSLRFYESIPHKDYLCFLKIADVLVGNSSSGIIETSFLKLPVINLGNRQIGRERAANVLDAPFTKKGISQALRTAMYDESFKMIVKNCKNPYGEGRAGKLIARVLSRTKIGRELLQKAMTY